MKKKLFYMFLATVMTFTSIPVRAEIVGVNDDVAVLSEDEVIFEGSEEEYQDVYSDTEDVSGDNTGTQDDTVLADEDETLLDASDNSIMPEYTGDVTVSPTQSKYDPREYGMVTEIKSQAGNLCWLYATMAAAESNLIKRGLADNTINLSELQVLWTMYHKVEDPLGYYTEDTQDTTMDSRHLLLKGGNNEEAVDTMARWTGPIYDSEATLDGISTANDTSKNVTVDPTLLTKSYWHLTGSRHCDYTKGETAQIKELISEYGGVAMAFYENAYWYYAEADNTDP